jgi:hypothetical protein
MRSRSRPRLPCPGRQDSGLDLRVRRTRSSLKGADQPAPRYARVQLERPDPNRGPHRPDRCGLRLKVPAHRHLLVSPRPRVAAIMPNPTKKPPPNKKPRICGGVAIGAPGFEPGTSPTRIMGEIQPAGGKALQIWMLGFRSASSQILGFSVDSRGLGSEIELLPNRDVADGRRVGTATFGREAAARATAQVPKSRVTTLDAGHSPSASRLGASPPRRPACVRDQS